MTFTITQWDFWQQIFESPPDQLDTCQYQQPWGKGSHRTVSLREGLDLSIDQYQLHQPIVIQSPDRPHSLEYVFAMDNDCYDLFGSGLAPAENWLKPSLTPKLEVCVHMELALFQSLYQEEEISKFSYLTRTIEQIYFQRQGKTTIAMKAALHQLLDCPFEGTIQKIYQESKVWELLALLLQEEQKTDRLRTCLKPEDIDRIYLAQTILIQQIDNPPSLIDLAHQVGLNDCTFKRGFREVFGTTAFGFLLDYRLEQARLLLLERRMNISQIAKKVGFASRGYFAKVFRQKYGLSPRDYLKNSLQCSNFSL